MGSSVKDSLNWTEEEEQEAKDYFKKQEEKKLLKEILLLSFDAGAVAAKIAEKIEPKLTAQEEAFFIAGFQECVKYLSMQGKGN